MRYLKALIFLVLLLNILLTTGCSSTKAPSLVKTDVEKEFLDSFNKTSKINYLAFPSTKITGKTFWIYIATDQEILTINSQSSVGGVTPEKVIKFVDVRCNYESSVFKLDYIFLKYTEEDREKERNLFKKSPLSSEMLYQDFTDQAIEILQKTYASIGDVLSKTEDMNFFAICLANIKKGMKITFVIHRLDIERFLLNMLPSDEFYNRMILKTDGGKDIINDKYGLTIEYNDISLVDFLREQIINNARSKLNEMEKYEPEKLKKIDKLDDFLLGIVYDVTSKYEFADYVIVDVEDLISKEKNSTSKSMLLHKFKSPSAAYSSTGFTSGTNSF